MYALSGSLRDVPLTQTLHVARRLAGRLGITRVTDITRLDRAGIPVFASIRPGAAQGSLCVNAGKGVTAEEAEVGAYMEAIEYAFAEESNVPRRLIPAGEILASAGRPKINNGLLDLCMQINATVKASELVPCVECEVLQGVGTEWIPAELIFLPCDLDGGRPLFGSHSNGLASGNSVPEATLHALLELLERDTRSFHTVLDTSVSVRRTSLGGRARSLFRNLLRSELQLAIRFLPNEFDVPCFLAVIYDPTDESPLFVNGGYGCHLDEEIAVTRAICEAAQSRLSWIHGARDDLVDRAEQFAPLSPSARLRYRKSLLHAVTRREGMIDFSQVPQSRKITGDTLDIQEAIAALLQRLRDRGFHQALVHKFTSSASPLQVVKVIVPGLEHYSEQSPRIGPRIHRYLQRVQGA